MSLIQAAKKKNDVVFIQYIEGTHWEVKRELDKIGLSFNVNCIYDTITHARYLVKRNDYIVIKPNREVQILDETFFNLFYEKEKESEG